MSIEKVKDDNYIVIQGWMINQLHLKGNELIIFAIIYGFSQAEGQMFTGSLQYLSEWTNSTKQGVIKAIKSLIEKGYIGKNDKYINGVKFCEYYSTKFNGVLNKVEWGGKQSLMGGIKQSLPNNIVLDNIDINNNINILECEFTELWKLYPRKDGKANALKAYIKARSRKDNPVSFETVKNGIERYVEYIKAENTPQKYIKQGSTWFNQQCWDDEYSVNSTQNKLPTAEDYDFSDWYN